MSSQSTQTDLAVDSLQKELGHLRSSWFCFLMMGILLAVCGLVALIFPALTILTSFAAVVILGMSLMVAGLATIITSFWAGKWSGTMLHLLVGILYIVSGMVIADSPVRSAVAMTAFMAAFFIIVGAFRTVAAFTTRFPNWGWSVLNGMVTFLIGVAIYRHFPDSALWVIGVLVGVELLFNGWTWITLSMALRRIPAQTA
jgi:uncharacterized membrane protein HdeD (DUF308 family)